MSHDLTPEHLRELVNDERARRAHAEAELRAERERVEIWRQRAEERAEAIKKLKARGRRRRHQGDSPSSAPSPAPSPPPPDLADGPLPLHPTVRVATWQAPSWVAGAFDTHDLAGGTDGLEIADLVIVGGHGAGPALDEWLTWPARAPLVVFDHEGADGLTRALRASDLFVGPTGRTINSIDPFPVVTAGPPPQAYPPWRDVEATTDPADIVQAASAGTPLRWLSGPGQYSELADIVAEPDSTRSPDKQSVIGRITANSRFGVGAGAARLGRGCGLDLADWRPSVGILLVSNRPERIRPALDQIARFTYPRIEVVLAIHGGADPAVVADLERWPDESGLPLRILTPSSDVLLGRCLNMAAESTGASVLAKVDDDDIYGPRYFDEAVDALTTSGADLVGKMSQTVVLADRDSLLLFQPGKENRVVGYVNGPTFVMRRRTWEDVGFAHRRARVDSTFVRGLNARGGLIFATSRFEFALWRTSSGHTWHVSDDYFLARSEVLGTQDQLAESMLG